MAQLVTRVADGVLDAIDSLVERGVVESRSDAVRIALADLLERERRSEVGRRIAEGYALRPQTDEELAGIDQGAATMIDEEPW